MVSFGQLLTGFFTVSCEVWIVLCRRLRTSCWACTHVMTRLSKRFMSASLTCLLLKTSALWGTALIPPWPTSNYYYMYYCFLKCKLFGSRGIKWDGWLSEWLSTQFFTVGYLTSGGRKRNKIWHKLAWGWGWCRNFEYTQRKHTIPHSTMNNNWNIIHLECCDNTHRGHHIPANRHALVLRTSVMLVTLHVS